MSPFTARHLRRTARDAAKSGTDTTDYTVSATARSFFPYYAQHISSAIVMNGSASILDGIKHADAEELRPGT